MLNLLHKYTIPLQLANPFLFLDSEGGVPGVHLGVGGGGGEDGEEEEDVPPQIEVDDYHKGLDEI